MVCTHFDYEFRIHGTEGGLRKTVWIFEPLPDRGDGSREMRDGVLAAADLHRELLDRVFARVLKGGRQPVLSGGEDRSCDRDEFTVTSGYQYVGKLTWTGKRLLRQRLRRLFGEHAVDMRGDPLPDTTHYANIGLSFTGERSLSGMHLWVSHKLPHAINACLFRHLLGLDAFGFEPRLTQKVERLDRLLTATAEGPGRGGYAVPAGLWHAGEAPRRLANGG